MSTTSINIVFPPQIEILSLPNYIFQFTGPRGIAHLTLNSHSYITHSTHSISIHTQHITPQQLKLIQHLKTGLIVGFRIKIYQSGMWIQMRRFGQHLRFKLGLSHYSYFKIPPHILFKSKRRGYFRIIQLYSISLQLLKDFRAQLKRLKPANIYRLDGFRYRIQPMFLNKKSALIKTKIGKK